MDHELQAQIEFGTSAVIVHTTNGARAIVINTYK